MFLRQEREGLMEARLELTGGCEPSRQKRGTARNNCDKSQDPIIGSKLNS